MAMVALHNGQKARLQFWLAITFLLGAAFIGMEINEFHHLIAEGASPQRSAFCRPSSRWSAPTACTWPAACCGWPC